MKVLLILVTFSAIGIACNRSQSDDKNKGQSESFEKKKQPNILFVISDDQSYPFASAYGYKAITIGKMLNSMITKLHLFTIK